MNILRQSDTLQEPNPPPAHIELIPRQPMPSRHRMRMMIVVPPFPKTQQRDEPVVARSVTGSKPPRTPKMRKRVDHPGSMQPHGYTEEHSPQQKWHPSTRQQRNRQDDQGHVMIFRDPDQE